MKPASLPMIMALAALMSASVCHAQSPYTGEETRAIPALAPAKITGLLAGKGLGYAKAAELNGYPGPAHVLELKDSLQLTEQQEVATQALMNKVKTDAMALGKKLVAAEDKLDSLFKESNAQEKLVQEALMDIANIESQLRGAHLKAHIEQKKLLNNQQLQRYIKLRGYNSGKHHQKMQHHGENPHHKHH